MSFPDSQACPSCGAWNPVTNRFCRTCRATIDLPSQTQAQPQPQSQTQTQQQAYTYSTPLPMYAPLQQAAFSCPYCHTNLPPLRQSKISGAGWAVFVVMLLVCFPLFWVGFLIKEEYTS